MTTITITRADHPSRVVQACAIPTDGPYLRQLWLPVCGPSVVALVGRCQELTARAGGPAEIGADDLARSIGLANHTRGDGPSPAGRPNGPFARTIVRARQFGLVDLGSDVDIDAHTVMSARLQFTTFEQVPPLRARQVARLPEFLKNDHYLAMDRVLERLEPHEIDLARFTDVGAPGGRSSARAYHSLRSMPAAPPAANPPTAQLDQLRAPQPAPPTPPALSI